MPRSRSVETVLALLRRRGTEESLYVHAPVQNLRVFEWFDASLATKKTFWRIGNKHLEICKLLYKHHGLGPGLAQVMLHNNFIIV